MNLKQLLGLFFIALAAILIVIQIVVGIKADFEWKKNFYSYWELADKSSTLDAKCEYIDEFVKRLTSIELPEYNAIFFPTPSNNVKKNLEALKSLQTRLHQVQKMDPNSFAYAKTIEQITAQEQGEAQMMLNEICGGWYLKYHKKLWDFWCILYVIGCFIILFIGGLYLNKGINERNGRIIFE